MSAAISRTALPLQALWTKTDAELQRAANRGDHASDSLVVFAALWGMATLFSAVSQTTILIGGEGPRMGVLLALVIANAVLLIWRPRQVLFLLSLSLLMATIYILRMPVSSNNQTIAMFMNSAILVVLLRQIWLQRTTKIELSDAYEQLRPVAKGLLATMYFFGIFHKINTGFLDPTTSCATALYIPLARDFGLDTNLPGRCLAIASTFIIEFIAIVCIYVRRYFWIGLALSLPFHYIIPISAYSWYMDFSSLVFALYMLSVPREVALSLYQTTVTIVQKFGAFPTGTSAIALLSATFVLGAVVVAIIFVAIGLPDRSYRILWHSAWLIAWAVIGGAVMVLIIRAALMELPYSTRHAPARVPAWLYIFPGVLFITCWSPYFGLKTESSIAMFSNLHTEGGVSNHLLFPKPPYLFPYQERTVHMIGSSNPDLLPSGDQGNYLVEHDLALRVLGNPEDWFTYEISGQRFERITAAQYTGYRPNWLETKFLDFKPVDWRRPKICTH